MAATCPLNSLTSRKGVLSFFTWLFFFFNQLNNYSKIGSNQKCLLVPTGFIQMCREVTEVDSKQYASVTVSTRDIEFMIRGGAACLSMPFLWHYTTVRSCALGLIQWDLRHNGYQAPSVLSDMRTNCKTNNCCNCKKLVYSSRTASGAAKHWAVGSRYSCYTTKTTWS